MIEEADLKAERDHAQLALAAEQGLRAPAGWRWLSHLRRWDYHSKEGCFAVDIYVTHVVYSSTCEWTWEVFCQPLSYRLRVQRGCAPGALAAILQAVQAAKDLCNRPEETP